MVSNNHTYKKDTKKQETSAFVAYIAVIFSQKGRYALEYLCFGIGINKTV